MGVIGPWQLLVIVDAINKDYTAETPKNETTAPSAPAAKPTDETTKN